MYLFVRVEDGDNKWNSPKCGKRARGIADPIIVTNFTNADPVCNRANYYKSVHASSSAQEDTFSAPPTDWKIATEIIDENSVHEDIQTKNIT
jgi:hypothetical protein